jgi:hypothetical protein
MRSAVGGGNSLACGPLGVAALSRRTAANGAFVANGKPKEGDAQCIYVAPAGPGFSWREESCCRAWV